MAKPDPKPDLITEQTVDLDVPIEQGTGEITKLILHRPKSGHLREAGINHRALVRGDVDQVLALLPHISEPKLAPETVDEIDPADLTQIVAKTLVFFIPRKVLAGKDLTTTA